MVNYEPTFSQSKILADVFYINYLSVILTRMRIHECTIESNNLNHDKCINRLRLNAVIIIYYEQ